MDSRDGARVAIYARYSSAMQNPRSVEDQFALCQRKIDGTVTAAEITPYADHAETATSMHQRSGLQQLLRDVENGRLDLVFAESLDRISRDLADLAGLYKRLRFHDVELFTVEEGQVGSLHVSLKGVMAQEQINSLALKTRRGMEGVIRQGRAAGGVTYGYRLANRIGPDGQAIRGLREIDPERAAVVRRIFEWYAAGKSTRKIAAQLNAEGVPAARGGLWTSIAINGSRHRRNGILYNELYRGRLVFGRTESRRDPDTGRRRTRALPEEEWTVAEVPELRIIDEELWKVAQLRRQAGMDRRRGRKAGVIRPLTPLIRCGLCGGRMTVHHKGKYVCLTRRETGACGNRRRVLDADVEQAAVEQLAEFVLLGADWLSDLETAGETVVAMRAEAAGEIAERQKRLDHLIEAIELGDLGRRVRNRIADLERQIAETRLHLRALDDLPRKPRAARALWEQLQERISILGDRAMSGEAETRRQALVRIVGLIERIEVVPGEARRGVRITVRPSRDALIVLAIIEDFEVAPSEPILDRLARSKA